MIKLSNVTKEFSGANTQVKAVDNVTFTINEREIFGIIGYSGAGKSTLIRMLNGLEKPTSGEIVVAGKDIGKLNKRELQKARQEISMIFQHFNILWSRTVRENISLPLEIAGIGHSERTKRVDELIRLVGLEGRENAYPSELSGGQKQRVGIARALANNPKVLLCDEATSALDPQTTDSILELLVDINQRLGLTIVLITHEMHVIRKICHRVAVMENGQVVESGDVVEIFRHPKQASTKRFVRQENDPEQAVGNDFNIISGQILQLTFINEVAGQPIIADVIKQFKVSINILQGKISQTANGAYGVLFVHIDGEQEEVANSIDYIRERLVEVEVLTNV